jgi:biopolymer transport protein ExbB
MKLVSLVYAVVLGVCLSVAVQAQEAPATVASGADESLTVDRVVREMKRQYKAGGATMHFITALSLLGAAFVLERLFRLQRRSVAPAGLSEQAQQLWQAGNLGGLEQLAQQHGKSTLGRIILFALKHRHNSVDEVNSVASDIASRDMARHMMFTYPLATVAVLAPLLGLFGTVVGMIESFETVAVAGTMGDPSLLSSSISKALVTTAYGLMVAMPILFCYHMIKVRTAYLSSVLDEEASTLINDWFLTRSAAKSAEASK